MGTNVDLDYEDNEDGGKLGRLFFTVKYSFEKTALIDTINKCSNLPAKDKDNKTSDPYVKLQLLPEKQHKVKTRVVRRTLHPVYDEDFTFYGVHFNQLPILTLHFVVLSFDRYSRDDVVGEVMVELEGMDLSSSETCPLSLAREITPRSDKLRSQGRGELLVSLCHQPAASRVTVGFEGEELAQDGHHRALRSVREDLPDVQWSTDLEEEDAREEANVEPGLQRVLRLRSSSQ